KSARDLGTAIAGAFVTRAVIRGTVGVFGTYERQLISVAKTADLSKQELGEFRGEIENLASEIKGVQIGNLLEVAEVAGQMGIKGARNIANFTRVMAELQTAAPSIQGERGAQIIA